MATLNQKVRWITNVYYYKWRRPKLAKSPQRRGVVLRLRICTPRKPNSARRPIVKTKLSSKKKALAHIPGKGHNLRKFSKIFVNGNGARDLPVVNYTCIRGVLDFSPLFIKRRRRSIYGVKQIPELKKHIRRRYRKILD